MNIKSKFYNLRYLHSTFLILGIFSFDCFVNNAVKIFMPGQAQNQDEWLRQIQLYNTAISFFSWIPYILLIYLPAKKFKFDGIDTCMSLVCLLSCVINSLDWVYNSNWRPAFLDWWVFVSTLMILFSLKLAKYRR